jgi:hypothetical protein
MTTVTIHRTELRMHLAWRWFTGLGVEQEIPPRDVSQEPAMDAFRSRIRFTSCLLFEGMVARCVDHAPIEPSSVLPEESILDIPFPSDV